MSHERAPEAAVAGGGITLADLVTEVFRRSHDRECVIEPATGTRWTYADVAARTLRWRCFFEDAGFRTGDGVALLARNRAEAVPALLAAFSSGLRYTPLNVRASLDDLAFILEDSEIRAVIADDTLPSETLDALRRRPSVTLVPVDAADSVAVRDPAPVQLTEDSIATITYTGGTTGRPKGVVQSHRTAVQCLMSEMVEWPWPRSPRLLAAAPLSHGSRHLVLPTMWRGGVIVPVPSADAESIATAAREQQVNCMFAVPSILYSLLDRPPARDGDLRSFEMIAYGGSPIAPERLAELISRFGRVFVQLYAQTEAPNTVTVLPPEDHDLNRRELLGSCGRPALGSVVSLRDGDDREVPQGKVGEICVRGRIVMDGYWKRPEETAAALKSGWLRTGDLAYADAAGYFYIVDRSKDMIISGGFNVFCGEVEQVLHQHESVELAAVFGIPDPRWGEAVVAAVVVNGEVTEDDLKAFVRERKGPVQTPKQIEFVREMPLTPLGKIDKKQLRDPHWAGRARVIG